MEFLSWLLLSWTGRLTLIFGVLALLGYAYRKEIFFGTPEEDAYCSEVDDELSRKEGRRP